MLDQKHLENVEYFKYSGCVITNDARRTRKIAMAKADLSSKLCWHLRKIVKCYILSIAFIVLKLGHCGK
jgi:hypothetical protein